ncbi:MAG: hypothetical protein AAGG59_07245 [Bacteroidota bacterium]
MNDKLKREVDKTMGSLDGVTKLKTSPYFYARLKARMEQETSWTASWKWSLAGTMVVIILNVVVMLNYSYSRVSEEEVIEQLAIEYSSEGPSIYNNDLTDESE